MGRKRDVANATAEMGDRTPCRRGNNTPATRAWRRNSMSGVRKTWLDRVVPDLGSLTMQGLDEPLLALRLAEISRMGKDRNVEVGFKSNDTAAATAWRCSGLTSRCRGCCAPTEFRSSSKLPPRRHHPRQGHTRRTPTPRKQRPLTIPWGTARKGTTGTTAAGVCARRQARPPTASGVTDIRAGRS